MKTATRYLGAARAVLGKRMAKMLMGPVRAEEARATKEETVRISMEATEDAVECK
jgi:hypothetical protein